MNKSRIAITTGRIILLLSPEGHLMFYAPPLEGKAWGADLPKSPVRLIPQFKGAQPIDVFIVFVGSSAASNGMYLPCSIATSISKPYACNLRRRVSRCDSVTITITAFPALSEAPMNFVKPDPSKFLKVTVDLIVEAAKAVKVGHAGVAACGECAPLFWAQGKAEAAIRVEHLWDEIANSSGLDVLCAYPLSSFQDRFGSSIFDKIRAEHSAVHSPVKSSRRTLRTVS